MRELDTCLKALVAAADIKRGDSSRYVQDRPADEQILIWLAVLNDELPAKLQLLDSTVEALAHQLAALIL